MIRTVAKTVGVMVLVSAVVVACDRAAGPFFSFSAQSWAPEPRGDAVIGVVEGPIKTADAATGTLHIASGFLGLTSLPLEVTADTIIGVRGKLGGVGDLDRGRLVRVAYEVAPDRLVARRVLLLDAASDTAVTVARASDVSPNSAPGAPARADAEAQPTATTPAVAAPVVVGTPSPARRPVETPSPARRPVETTSPARRTVETPSPARRRAEAPSPSEPSAPARAADENRSPARPVDANPPASKPSAVTPEPREPAELPARPEVKPAAPPPSAPPAVSPSVAPTPRPGPPARPPVAAKPPAARSADVSLPPRRQRDDAGTAVIDWLLTAPPARPQAAEAP